MTVDFNSKDYLAKVDAWWRAANYISVGQTFLKDNALLKRPLVPEDIKRKPIGHWGTIPGGNFIYAHLNRVINKYDLNMMMIIGPGHAGPVMATNSYMDGSYTELYPELTQDEEGLNRFFKQFSFPGGIGSHATPQTPGSIHEGGELGYSISHAVGSILDNPDLIAVPFIGDGEAETGPLMTSWLSNVFINPVNDGAVLPVLHLNGAKISNPTILARKTNEELIDLFNGLGWEPYFIEGEDPEYMHERAAEILDKAIESIKAIQEEARKKTAEEATRAKWPVILLRTPKGWTGPREFDGKTLVGSFRSHQIPLPVTESDPATAPLLEEWLRSYRPEELFDENARLVPELAALAPKPERKMATNPITNGGDNVPPVNRPDWTKYALDIKEPGSVYAQDMIELGKYTSEVIEKNPTTFRVFGPDETASNRLQRIFDVTNRQWLEPINENLDEFVSPAGRVIDSQLSEHQAQGFLEGYVLTGRHGFYASYESFIRVTDSMLTQHFKWLKKCTEISWRKPVSSLNLIASSYVFQQDHNGFTHQDPGVLTHLAEKTPEFIREYLPADTNSLLAVFDKVYQSEHKINVVVASKHVRPQFYSIEEAKELVDNGYKIIDWASTCANDEEPDVIMVASGTEPNLEILAAISYLNAEFPDLKIRFVNVVDLLKLRHPSIDKRGLSDEEFNEVFTTDKPIIFGFHGYEGLIRDIFYLRENRNLHIHGYREEGDITTPFDMRVYSEMDRFHIAKQVAELVRAESGKEFIDKMDETLDYHHNYIRENGSDIAEVEEWEWKPLN